VVLEHFLARHTTYIMVNDAAGFSVVDSDPSTKQTDMTRDPPAKEGHCHFRKRKMLSGVEQIGARIFGIRNWEERPSSGLLFQQNMDFDPAELGGHARVATLLRENRLLGHCEAWRL
jgi:hypothetical protein